jgi:DNA-binding MarR family transcriptional regulator
MCYGFRMASTDVKQAPHWAPTAGMLLLKIGKAAERRFEKALKPSGLTPRHLGVLFEVQARPTSQQALIETIGVDPSKLVGLLNDLEADGLIVRKRDPVDRRRHIVEVSAKGSARLEDAKQVAATVEEELLAGLDADQRAELLALLAQVADSSGIFEGCVERLSL